MKYFIFFLSFNVFCQINKVNLVEFQEIRETQLGSLTLNFSLFFDNVQSLYIEKSNDSIINKTFTAENSYEQELLKIVNNYKSEDYYCYKKKSETQVFYNEETSLNQYHILDESFTLNWRISNETKKINNFNCIMAQMEFRGREYTAWFTTEIPFPYGPGKYSGLPGLILEIYDVDKKIYCRAIKINFNVKNTFLNDFVKKLTTYPKLSFKQFTKQRCIDHHQFIEKRNASLGRGGYIVSREVGSNENIEKDLIDCTKLDE